jgi:hypothetical protein
METLAEKVIRIVGVYEKEYKFDESFDSNKTFFYSCGHTMQQIIDDFKNENINCAVEINSIKYLPFKCVVNE